MINTFEYIEDFCNSTRQHSTPGYKLERDLRKHMKIL